jgi:hypothetical protein
MLRPRSVILAAAFVVLLLACGAPGTRGDPAPVLGPYAVARTGFVPLLRAQPSPADDGRAGALIFREPHRMCQLRGNRGSC